jgi:hypothetical protein
MNTVTEFYAIFTYGQLHRAKYEYRDVKCMPDLAEEPCVICGELFGEPEHAPTRNKQRIAVTSCFHLFHEACIQDYITGIFREYVAAAYARVLGVDANNNIVTLLPDRSQRNADMFAINQNLNPFGRAEPNGIYTLRKTTCPLCRHPLDQRLPPNTEMKRCFIRYFMRTGLVYPDLISRIVFTNDSDLQWYNVAFVLERGVGENIIRLRNRANTIDYYSIPENAYNVYFRLPNVRQIYSAYSQQNITDLSLVYADVVGEEPRPVVPAAPLPQLLLPTCKAGRGGDLDVEQAKELLIRRGLSPRGNKTELCARLIENNLARPYASPQRARARSPVRMRPRRVEAVPAVPAVPAILRRCSNGKRTGNELSVDEAKLLLRQARLPTTGNKTELCHRLRENGLSL